MSNPRLVRRPSSPGVILRREAAARDWTPEDVAEAGIQGRWRWRGQVGQIALELEHLVHDDAALTLKLALILARAFGTSVGLWADLERNYREISPDA